ncbi:RNA/RNP complex-1-interacting phosphatase-like [Varroa jacobsoni]|uniref:Tyrosine specific protein phosphatases domain-containing protein n=1 Tax=Varroa destructor TaxID=109461 RepID=A0A7M7K7P5_VARDE|nr:RNA/RNP complex-1-interacting phosphatase-like [Varroa destructor]XP_022711838.1 RNA/RNP complex-1-interacting phosphatase-like [Varroa jacobsoni]
MPRPPTKWSDYSAFRDVVRGTRFIPFKTPYKERVRGENFNVEVLMRKMGNLGFVLNLVKTDRYYNPAAYKRNDIKTFHIRLEGHGQVPRPQEMEKIFATLKQYMNMETDETKLIGVHCTHGVNRTGYVICRYMIEKLGMTPQDAINRFCTARGYRFDHPELEEDLLKYKPSIDEEALAFHSIGGKITPRFTMDGIYLDVDEALRRRGMKQQETSGADNNVEDNDIHHPTDDKQIERPDNDRHKERRDFDRYGNGEDPEWLEKYLGPRRLRHSYHSVTHGLCDDEIRRYLGPERRTILEEY